MRELQNRIGQAWRRHPVIDGLLGYVGFVAASLLIINFILPAWAASFPVGNLFVVNLDDWAPWMGIGVTILIWWEARRARNKATEAAALAAAAGKEIKAVAVQIDGLLAERDKAKVKEGEAKEKLVGEDTAATLAKGQEQGRASERERVTAQGPTTGSSHQELAQAATDAATAAAAIAAPPAAALAAPPAAAIAAPPAAETAAPPVVAVVVPPAVEQAVKDAFERERHQPEQKK